MFYLVKCIYQYMQMTSNVNEFWLYFIIIAHEITKKSKCWIWFHILKEASDWAFISVDQSCPTLCDPMNHSSPGLPVHHQLPEFTQAHFHWGGDVIKPSHPLLPPSPPALNLSWHQGLFFYPYLKWKRRLLSLQNSVLQLVLQPLPSCCFSQSCSALC